VPEEFVYVGSVKDTSPYAVQKLRLDGRLVGTDRKNFYIDSQKELVLIDSKESGDLLGIRIVSDNPYLEVLFEIDDWRYSVTIAELLAEPETGRLHSNLYAIDGGSPHVGYALLFNPDIPETYEKRLRVVLKNKIKKSVRANAGSLLNIETIAGGAKFYQPKGNQPIPTNIGHAAGFMLTDLNSIQRIQLDFNEGQVGVHRALSLGLEIDFLNTPGIPNSQLSNNIHIKKGVLHPYVGTAGELNLTANTDLTSEGTRSIIHVFFDDGIDTGNSKTPTPKSPLRTQDIYFVDFADTGSAPPAFTLQVGDRICIRENEKYYFPGVITAPPSSPINLPVKFAKNGTSQYVRAYQVTCAPGLSFVPPAVRFIAGGPGDFSVSQSGLLMVQSKGETNPKIHIKSAEVKRRKRVSMDG
jgi:hypothetical protein